MALRKNGIGALALALLAGILLALLNPDQADFKAYRADSKGLGGALLSRVYERRNFGLFSTFTVPAKGGSSYLGIAKLFIKLK